MNISKHQHLGCDCCGPPMGLPGPMFPPGPVGVPGVYGPCGGPMGLSSPLTIAICWGFFAPLHQAHLSLFYGARDIAGPYGKVLVLVNDDKQLAEKKNGLVVMDLIDRIEILKSLKPIDSVADVHGLEYSKELVKTYASQYIVGYESPPKLVMCMGGDRSTEESLDPELIQFCKDLDIDIVYGIGGYTKTKSSSSMIDNVIRWYENQKVSHPHTNPVGPDCCGGMCGPVGVRCESRNL